MKRHLGWIAALCSPFFMLGVAVSVRSYWSATKARIDLAATAYQLRADEQGVVVTRFSPPRLHIAPDVPQVHGWYTRLYFIHLRKNIGRVRVDLYHLPYWPLWLATTPPIVGWLSMRARERLRARRRKRNACVSCGYNLTGNVSGICPECGQPVSAATASESAVKLIPANHLVKP